MTYADEQINSFEKEYLRVRLGLEDLMLKTVVAGQESPHDGVKEHLLHGVSRRISIIKKAIENIFSEFPPNTTHPLDKEVLSDVQINLHAYVMNLYGIFDNWAWAYIYNNDLLKEVGGKHGVGLFRANTVQHLPQQLRNYLSQETMINWHEQYLKSHRDALAHRIPLYVPPAEFTSEEGELYNKLESDKLDLIKTMNWDRLDNLYKEQAAIGKPSFVFLHSYEEEPPQPVLFHPQLLCDAATIVEFGALYMEHWHESA